MHQLRGVRAVGHLHDHRLQAAARSPVACSTRVLVSAWYMALCGSMGFKAANVGRACRCAPACSREHPSAREDVAVADMRCGLTPHQTPDGLRMPCGPLGVCMDTDVTLS
eukprot:706672-Prymnesium_polylepis.1